MHHPSNIVVSSYVIFTQFGGAPEFIVVDKAHSPLRPRRGVGEFYQ
jgi:hypothetical protein